VRSWSSPSFSSLRVVVPQETVFHDDIFQDAFVLCYGLVPGGAAFEIVPAFIFEHHGFEYPQLVLVIAIQSSMTQTEEHRGNTNATFNMGISHGLPCDIIFQRNDGDNLVVFCKTKPLTAHAAHQLLLGGIFEWQDTQHRPVLQPYGTCSDDPCRYCTAP